MKPLFFFALATSAVLFAGTDPVGQTAHYVLDTNPSRTSSMVKSGTIDTAITALVNSPEGPAYEVVIDYRYRLHVGLAQTGSETLTVDATYFEPEFMEDLRVNGSYEGPNFKAEHRGYADATTLSGDYYPNCDKIYMYDFVAPSQIANYFSQLLLPSPSTRKNEVKDMTAIALVYPGLPVLGAVKLDVAGKYQGIPIKAGGDYVSQRVGK